MIYCFPWLIDWFHRWTRFLWQTGTLHRALPHPPVMSQEATSSGNQRDKVSNDPSYFRFPTDFRSAGAQDRPPLRFGIDRILSTTNGTPEVMQSSDRKSITTKSKSNSFHLKEVLRMDMVRGSCLSLQSPPCHAPLPSWCTFGPVIYPGVSIIPWRTAAADAGAIFSSINSG